jgi:SAM-dependent methyltransferase
MLAAADQFVPAARTRVELGSGGGFLAEIDSRVITSDIRPLADLQIVFNATHAPLRSESVDVLYGMHVMHHIPRIRSFFHELERLLSPSGVFVAVEPYWSPFARLMYKHAHPEPFDEHARTWEFTSSGPMSSNQALSFLCLERDREIFSEEFPGLEPVRLESFGGPSYLLTGGIWKKPLLGDRLIARIWDFEERHAFWRQALALHHLFVVRRRLIS